MRDTVVDLQKLAEAPETWRTAEPNHLLKLTFYEVGRYGMGNDAESIPRLMELYEVLVERTQPEQRVGLLMQVTSLIEKGSVSVNALMPFIFVDIDHTVISTASLNLAVLLPLIDGDPMSGPRHLRELAEELTDEVKDQDTRLGIISGLLLTGDRRATPYLDGCWNLLDREHQQLLTHSTSQFAYATAMDFFLDWLEVCLADGDEEMFGIVAATLYRAADLARESGGVIDVERVFPATAAGDAQPVRLLSKWTARKYGRVLTPRFRDIAARESEPRIMPAVEEHWRSGRT